MKKQSMYETVTGKKKKRVGIVFSFYLYSEIKRIACESNMTIQEYIRQIVDMIVAANKKENA